MGQTIVGTQNGDEYGKAAAISADGLRVALGGSRADMNGCVDNGYVRVFELQGGSWVQLGQTRVTNTASTRSFFSMRCSTTSIAS